MFSIEPLPYAYDALEPAISARTLSIHYEKHHRGYLHQLRRCAEGTPAAHKSLEELIATADGPLHRNAAQVWNHSFYWRGMRPGGGGRPDGMLLQVLEQAFGSFSQFKQEFAEAANEEFGSGWAWLVRDLHGRLRIQHSSDAGNPLEHDYLPLLAIDVWEHAYYLDYQHRRDRYVERFLDDLVDWGHVAARLQLPSDERIAAWEAEERREEEARWGTGEDPDASTTG